MIWTLCIVSVSVWIDGAMHMADNFLLCTDVHLLVLIQLYLFVLFFVNRQIVNMSFITTLTCKIAVHWHSTQVCNTKMSFHLRLVYAMPFICEYQHFFPPSFGKPFSHCFSWTDCSICSYWKIISYWLPDEKSLESIGIMVHDYLTFVFIGNQCLKLFFFFFFQNWFFLYPFRLNPDILSREGNMTWRVLGSLKYSVSSFDVKSKQFFWTKQRRLVQCLNHSSKYFICVFTLPCLSFAYSVWSHHEHHLSLTFNYHRRFQVSDSELHNFCFFYLYYIWSSDFWVWISSG